MGLIALLLTLVSGAYLAGLSWTVQLVVYPSFALVGPDAFAAYHAAHTKRILAAVGPMWLAEAVGTLGWIASPPHGTKTELAIAAAAALASVIITGASAVPAHAALAAGFEPKAFSALMRANAVRTAAWTLATAASAWALWTAIR